MNKQQAIRKGYTKKLRETADYIENNDLKIKGMCIHIFFEDGSYMWPTMLEPGFNLLSATGIFFKTANKFAEGEANLRKKRR